MCEGGGGGGGQVTGALQLDLSLMTIVVHFNTLDRTLLLLLLRETFTAQQTTCAALNR